MEARLSFVLLGVGMGHPSGLGDDIEVKPLAGLNAKIARLGPMHLDRSVRTPADTFQELEVVAGLQTPLQNP